MTAGPCSLSRWPLVTGIFCPQSGNHLVTPLCTMMIDQHGSPSADVHRNVIIAPIVHHRWVSTDSCSVDVKLCGVLASLDRPHRDPLRKWELVPRSSTADQFTGLAILALRIGRPYLAKRYMYNHIIGHPITTALNNSLRTRPHYFTRDKNSYGSMLPRGASHLNRH